MEGCCGYKRERDLKRAFIINIKKINNYFPFHTLHIGGAGGGAPC
jgi:hypothetical protein